MIGIQTNQNAAPGFGSGGHGFTTLTLRPIGVAALLILLTTSLAACQNGSSSSAPKLLAPPAVSSGVRIAITKAVRQGKDLWLTFRISSANPATPNMWLVGGGLFQGLIPVLPQDVQFSGLRFNEQNQAGNRLIREMRKPTGTPRTTPPYPTPFVRAYDNTESLLITGKSGVKLGVTIRKLRFEKGSTGIGKVISGDWVFSFVLPSNLPTPTPTPTMPVK